MIWNIDGEYQGFIQTPHRTGACSIYVRDDILCVRHEGRGIENGNILLYNDLEYTGKIRFKDEGSQETELTVFDDENRELLKSPVNSGEEVVCYEAGRLCYNDNEINIDDQLFQKELKSSNGNIFKVEGISLQSLVMLEQNGNEKVIRKETMKEFIIHSDLISMILVLVVFINLKKLLGLKMTWQGR